MIIYKLRRFWIYRKAIILNIKSFKILEGSSLQFLLDCLQKKIRQDYKIRTLNGVFRLEAFGNFDQLYTLNPFVEFQLHRYLLSHESDCFVDVGAFVGSHSISYACKFNKSMVISIEPAKANFRLLERNIALNSLKNVSAMNVAAAKRREHQFFGQDISSKHINDVNEDGEASVALPIDEVILNVLPNCENILIKVDVEGSEIDVVEGLMGTFARVPEVALVVEILNQENFDLVSQIVSESGLKFIRKVSGSNYVFEKQWTNSTSNR